MDRGLCNGQTKNIMAKTTLLEATTNERQGFRRKGKKRKPHKSDQHQLSRSVGNGPVTPTSTRRYDENLCWRDDKAMNDSVIATGAYFALHPSSAQPRPPPPPSRLPTFPACILWPPPHPAPPPQIHFHAFICPLVLKSFSHY